MRYFFVFSYGDPHLAHVVRGEEKHTLELVRILVRKGAVVNQLHYLSAVLEGTHHERERVAASHIPEGGHEPPQVSSSQVEIDQWARRVATDDMTLSPDIARVRESI